MKYFIFDGDVVYTRMLLFSWEGDSPPVSLTQTNAEFVISEIDKYVTATGCKIIYINCNLVVDIDDHFANILYRHFVDINVSFVLFSTDNKDTLVEHMSKRSAKDEPVYQDDGVKILCVNYPKVCSSTVLSKIRKCLSLEKEKINEMVSETYKVSQNPELMYSTPLKSSGQFNASIITSNPYRFRWIVLLLSEAISIVIKKNKIKDFTIVAASLRGAAIAGSIREILYYINGGRFSVIDHIGPKHGIIEGPAPDWIESKYCIYIGDFLIAGTEVRITDVYCNFFGVSLIHAFVIGKYTSVERLNDRVELHSLVDLKKCVEELEYRLD